MNVTWYIARRYFKGGHRESGFLSFIKIMAIAGVAVGSAGLLISLSIVHGFKSTINEKILGFAPHITIQPFVGEPLQRADTLQPYLETFEGVSRVEPAIIGNVMIQAASGISGTVIKGVNPGGDLTQLGSYIVEGEYTLAPTNSGLPGILLGQSLAGEIGASIGSRVTVFALDGLPSPLNTPEIRQYTLTGMYSTGIDRFDDSFAIADISTVRTLFGLGVRQSSVMEINVSNTENIRPVYGSIRDGTQFPLVTENVYQRYRNIFAWIDLQEETIPLVIGVMVIVAAFNLIGTVLMMVLERVRDVGILKTMGAKSAAIRKIFLLEGIFVAVSGLVIGIGISLLFYFLQTTYEIIPLSEENYYMSTAPVEPHMLDFFIVGAVTIILCVLASWLPARIAAKTDPVQVLSFGR
ncbi:MAG: FtsX-like permease family protein [Bacteroidetes bacterium]|jgi:lipoprotein-releasing system permease protein|nr:FtsX-like permease family protein [Bacteroidota bacterium]